MGGEKSVPRFRVVVDEDDDFALGDCQAFIPRARQALVASASVDDARTHAIEISTSGLFMLLGLIDHDQFEAG